MKELIAYAIIVAAILTWVFLSSGCTLTLTPNFPIESDSPQIWTPEHGYNHGTGPLPQPPLLKLLP